MATIQENVLRVREEIARVCQKIGRDPKEITLVGVTKFASVEAIQEAINAGVTDIAENKVQEGLKKYPGLQSSSNQTALKRHLIGHLQTNKVKDALKIFDLIQSVDSLKVAQEVEKQALKLNRTVDVLVQVNIAGEEQKFGADKQGVLTLIGDILQLKNIHIRGLMTMAPFTEDQKIVRDCFKGLRELRDQVVRDFKGNSTDFSKNNVVVSTGSSSEPCNMEMKYLSMGMSGDFKIALEEGSNMIRVGSAIFKNG